MLISLSYLPNLITLTRLVLTGPIVWSLLTSHTVIALCLLVVAAVTDWMDGWLARAYAGWNTQLGAFLDPVADKVLLVSTFLTFNYLSQIPSWVVGVAVGRDLVIVAGILVYRLWIGPLNYEAIFSSKVNTVLQITLILLILINQTFFNVPAGLLKLTSVGTVLSSAISLAQYAKLWLIKIRHHGKGIE